MSEQWEDEVSGSPNSDTSKRFDASLRSQESLQEEHRIRMESGHSSFLQQGRTRDAKRPGTVGAIDDTVLKRQRKQELIDEMRQLTKELSNKTAPVAARLQLDLDGAFGTRQSAKLSASQTLSGQLPPGDFPTGMIGATATIDFERHQSGRELLARQTQYVEDLRREKVRRARRYQERIAAIAAYPLLQQQQQRREMDPHDRIRSFQDPRRTARLQSPSLYASATGTSSDVDVLLSLGRYSERGDDGMSSYPRQSAMERQSSDRFASAYRGLGGVPDGSLLINSNNHNADAPLGVSHPQKYEETQRTTERNPTHIRLPPGKGIPLAVPSDLDMLSRYQRMIRESIEFFQVESVDLLSNKGRAKNVEPGQIGLRCRFCAHRSFHRRGRGAVYFPGNLSCVYQSAQNMATSHLLGSCEDVTQKFKDQMRGARKQQDQETRRSGGKTYWVEACRSLGLGEREGMNGIWLQ